MDDLTKHSIGDVVELEKFPGCYRVTFWTNGRTVTYELDQEPLRQVRKRAEQNGRVDAYSLPRLILTWPQVSYLVARMFSVSKGWRSGPEASQEFGLAISWGPNMGCWQVVDGWLRIKPLFEYTEETASMDQYHILLRLKNGWDPWDDHPKLGMLLAAETD